MADPRTCPHAKTDLSWSHGELRRCTDCGAVEDPYDSGQWNDIVREAVASAAAGCEEAVHHFTEFMKVGRGEGIPYPQLSEADVHAAGELLREAAAKA